jgi:PCI domain
VLSKHGIDNDECVSNMRLLSLCSLATEHEEIPYSAVSETLQVDEDDVEEWVLRATQVCIYPTLLYTYLLYTSLYYCIVYAVTLYCTL